VGVGDAAPPEAPHSCPNCGAAVAGAYCPACGQRAAELNPTLGDVARDAAGDLFNWDGKIPATLKALLLQPGRLTADFLAGRRARWLSPFRVYVICSVAFFLSGPLVERITGRAAREVAKLTMSADAAGGSAVGSAADPVARAEAIAALRQYVDSAQAADVVDNLGALNDQFLAQIPTAMFILMPLFALITWAAWRGGDLRYPAHLYFSLHLHAAFFAWMTVARLGGLAQSVVLDLILGIGGLVYSTWYSIVALKSVLGGTPGQVALRSAVLGIVYGTAFTAVMIALLALSVLSL